MDMISIVLIGTAIIAGGFGVFVGQVLQIFYGNTTKQLHSAISLLKDTTQYLSTKEVSKEHTLNNDALTVELELCKEQRDNALLEAVHMREVHAALTDSYIDACNSSIDLRNVNTFLVEEQASLEAQIMELKFPKVTHKETPKDSEETIAAVKDVLNAMGNLESAYEFGVYNGIVSVANTLFNTELEMKVPTKVEPKISLNVDAKRGLSPKHHTVRGANGKFAPRATA